MTEELKKVRKGMRDPSAAADPKNHVEKVAISSGILVGKSFQKPDYRGTSPGKILAALHYGFFLCRFEPSGTVQIVPIEKMLDWTFFADDWGNL